MSRTTKNWLFVLRNYTPDDIRAIDTWISSSIKFVICSEDFDENAMPYLRGFIVTRSVRYTQLSKLNSRVEWYPHSGCRNTVLAMYLSDHSSIQAGSIDFHRLPISRDLVAACSYAKAGDFHLIEPSCLVRFYHLFVDMFHACKKTS